MEHPNLDLQIEMRDTASLVRFAKNARTHSPEQVKQIAESIRRFGFVNPILLGEDDVIIAGHGRLEGAELIGLPQVPTIRLGHLDEVARIAFGLADNQIALNAGWDETLLGELFQVLDDAGYDLAVTGFSDDFLDEIMAGLDGGGGGAGGPMEGEDDVPAPPVVPVTRPGDVWILGTHRIACGDSTNADVVRAALAGAKPVLMVTDPPYGVEYDPEWRNDVKGVNEKKTDRTGVVLNDDRADWREAWALFPGDVAYVWHGGLHGGAVQASLEACRFGVRAQIIWNKQQLIFGRGHYHWKHEPCFYAVRAGGTGNWKGDRKQSTVWDIASGGQDADTIHSTQKPVECMRRPILNHTVAGDAVYEPFSGSGTTIIACEVTARHARAVELNPAYVDVAVRRWENFTGKKAKLEDGGASFVKVEAERNGGKAPPPAEPAQPAPVRGKGRGQGKAPPV